MKNKVIFIAGPTATGKSAAAVCLAKKINGEIISCDSMQVYKDMNILTSTPSLKSQKKIKHHLLGIVSPEKEYDVSRYRKEAIQKIKQIVEKGKIPVLVGGTGLYMAILIDGIFKLKKPDEKIRSRLYKEAARKGNMFLYERLRKIDREASEKIHPNDRKRVIRALEVFEASGKPISLLQKQREGLSADYDIRIYCLDLARPELYDRIEKRVDKMFKRGLINEVGKLRKLKLSKTASCAIGIKEVNGYLNGEYGLEQAKNMMKQNTRAYAKRQLTWFRKDKRIDWIKVVKKDSPAKIASRMAARI